MKRKLIALAVVGAFVAPAAMADVTIYGVMDASFDATSTGGVVGGNSVSTTKVSSSQSRIGFKGMEDVGGGTNVLWQIENGINSDNNAGAAGTWNNRNTFVGLSGDSWGTVLLGNNDSPYKSATRGMDMFADTIADNRNIMGLATTAGAASNSAATAQFDGRTSSSVTYTTPDLGGFKLSGQYAAGAETATTQAQVKGSAYALSGVYASGPITGALAYAVHDFGTTATGTLGTAVAGDVNKKERALKVAGGYAVDQFSVNLVFEKSTDDMAAPGSTSSDRKAWYLGGKYNLSGTDAVKLAYTSAGNVGNPAANNTSVKQISVGYDHAMSKRTKVYALWSKVTNDTAAAYGLGTGVSTGAVAASAVNADPSAVSIGVKHSF